jgi:hypothetical protein
VRTKGQEVISFSVTGQEATGLQNKKRGRPSKNVGRGGSRGGGRPTTIKNVDEIQNTVDQLGSPIIEPPKKRDVLEKISQWKTFRFL